MKSLLSIILGILFLGVSNQNLSDKKNIYCYEPYDKYRNIKYWGRTQIILKNFNHKSGDAETLGLTGEKINYVRYPSKQIHQHFKKEFERLIKNKLPYHNVDEGRSERASEYLKKNKFTRSTLDELDALEEARRNSLYGPNPGQLYCDIKINRTEFPVLYIIECSIQADTGFFKHQSSSLKKSKLGFSTPEHIEKQIIRDITFLLEKITAKKKVMDSCKK